MLNCVVVIFTRICYLKNEKIFDNQKQSPFEQSVGSSRALTAKMYALKAPTHNLYLS